VSEIEQQNIASKPRNRRAVVKGAAWSVPVIAAAIAAPAASASLVGNASTALTTPNSNLLNIQILGGGLLTANVGVTVPTILNITNGLGAITGDITGTIVIAPTSGVNVGVLGYPRGFGVADIQNAAITSRTHNGTGGVAAPSPTTTTQFTYSGGITSEGSIDLPISFGLTDKTSLVALNALTTFTVTVTLTNNGNTIVGGGSITVPLNAGLL